MFSSILGYSQRGESIQAIQLLGSQSSFRIRVGAFCRWRQQQRYAEET